MRVKLILRDIIEELRSIKAFIIVFCVSIILLVSVTSMFYSIANSNQNGKATNYKAVLYMYNNLIFIEFMIVVVIIPLIAGTSYSKEYKDGTLDLLLLSKVQTIDFLLSKIMRCLIFNILLVSISLPMLCVVFSVGGVSLWDIIKFFIVIAITTLFFSCIGIYFSVRFKAGNRAILCTYAVEGILIFGTTFIFNIIYNIFDKVKNRAFYNGVSGAEYEKIQFEFLGNLLVGNPIFNLYKLQSDIVGKTSKFDITMNNFGINLVVNKIWIFISISLQLFVVFWLIRKIKKIMFVRHSK